MSKSKNPTLMTHRLPVRQAVFLSLEYLKSPGSDTVPVRFRLAAPYQCPHFFGFAGIFAIFLHTPLQESSKTADDGASAPREWCGCSGCMVHSGRRHGAHGRRAFPLFGNTFALAHGFTLDLDGVGVVDDPVTDGVGQGGVVQVLVPLAGVVLGAEDGGGHLAPGLY